MSEPTEAAKHHSLEGIVNGALGKAPEGVITTAEEGGNENGEDSDVYDDVDIEEEKQIVGDDEDDYDEDEDEEDEEEEGGEGGQNGHNGLTALLLGDPNAVEEGEEEEEEDEEEDDEYVEDVQPVTPVSKKRTIHDVVEDNASPGGEKGAKKAKA